jgi:tRNA threonylcarbamoyladenosine biosynthesis protein TsaB
MSTSETERAELSLDTASDFASIALSSGGSVMAEYTWHCRANHSVEVLPAVDRLLGDAGVGRDSLQVIFVCRGPGSYGGLRVGISLGMAIASALAIPVLGVGRLEVDAYQHAAHAGSICAIHRAGRGQLACAIYRPREGDLEEVLAPALLDATQLSELAPPATLFCGEIDPDLAERLTSQVAESRIASPASSVRRAGMLAEFAWRRFDAGERADYGVVEALYLREPNITKPKPCLQPHA